MGGEGATERKSTASHGLPLLHTRALMRRTPANRVFAVVYLCVILALLYHHFIALLHSTSILSLLILLADAVLAFMWVTSLAFRMCPTERQVFIEHLEHYAKESEYPALDVFICTADPFKEPPIDVVNTALSVMAYDYPIEKLSVYVSDDGGSQLTLFAFMEAARFATHWLPYCKINKIVERCPEAYFASNPSWFPETDQIKSMYERMRDRVENVVKRGSISNDYIPDQREIEAFSRWTDEFTPQNHPPVIQVLLERGKDKDITGHDMPNLVYISREKRMDSPHHFKAGALNVLLRVSATMTNAPVILTLDGDMYSNDPQTPLRVLCYLLDPSMDPKLGYVQFPQIFHGINKSDIYDGELRHVYQVQLSGMDGLAGPQLVGSGSFFRRKIFFGGPSETPEMNQDQLTSKSIRSKEVLAMAHHVAGCNFGNQTKWGTKMGFRYGSLVEDLHTSYQLQCEGWKSINCKPKRPAFLGNSPLNLHDSLNQTTRWSVGLLEVVFCKHNPIIYGVRFINLLSGLGFAYYAFWPFWSVPLTIYAFLPQLALLNSTSIFPKVSDPWFFVNVFLFLGAYGQDYLEFILSGGTTLRWWNNQRMWMMRGLSSFPFGWIEYFLKSMGISTFGFNVTSKVVQEEQSKRYKEGIFDFGVASPLFLPLTTAAIINLASFLKGIALVFKQGGLEDLLLQMLLAGFGIVNCWPIYEAMVLRTDEGKLPVKITLISIVLAWALY
ncbi:cellulose synthase-like protein G3 [Vitis vinifera]|uniref:cellulose synthase-like protein G3 n=1 Tax=Vitis vinifera TaxID=29760 RepID=UPI0001982D7F|nr:cellulose synthase-like protein G3 [Vitis vinifera]|eukprot:XP_002264299.1 PREDICTED: cellulose synthase-like protein G3 [Vitis vinifera]